MVLVRCASTLWDMSATRTDSLRAAALSPTDEELARLDRIDVHA